MRTLVLLTFCLAGCATTPQAEDVRTTHLVCGSTVRLDISVDGRQAVMRDGEGLEVVLQRTDSTLGTRYAGEGVSVMRSNDVYIYTDRDGHTANCDILPR